MSSLPSLSAHWEPEQRRIDDPNVGPRLRSTNDLQCEEISSDPSIGHLFFDIWFVLGDSECSVRCLEWEPIVHRIYFDYSCACKACLIRTCTGHVVEGAGENRDGQRSKRSDYRTVTHDQPAQTDGGPNVSPNVFDFPIGTAANETKRRVWQLSNRALE